MPHRGRRLACAALAGALAAGGIRAGAQFDPARVTPEPPAVAARFPEPSVAYPTPAFAAGRTTLPSHDEAEAFVTAVAARAPQTVTVEHVGTSQQGRAMLLVTLAAPGGPSAARPSVLVLAQQHGNEPAGGEAALALVDRLAGDGSGLLDRVNVYVMPRANPDGAARFVRATASGATAGDRWVKKYGVVQHYDALLQPATVGNLEPSIAREAARHFLTPVRQRLTAEGLRVFTYHTTSPDPADRVVSAGGVQPDTGRNVNGLRQAVSLLIETRGVGVGRAHLGRRVHTHVTAALTVVGQAAARGARLLAVTRGADAAVTAAACTGMLTVAAEHTPMRMPMSFLDAVSGEERRIVVPWRSADTLRVVRARPRPCGYLVDAGETAAVARLRLLGVRVTPAAVERRWDVETYRVVAQSTGARQDARGAIDDGAPIAVLSVRRLRRQDTVPAGSWFVDLAQPLGTLAAAALEPDSQNSFAASGLLAAPDRTLRRVMAAPPAGAFGTTAR